MTTGSPSRAYYEACRGRWRAPVAIEITDPQALATSGMSWLDRASLRLLAVWPRWLGRVFLDTAVEVGGDEVTHTTIVRWLGLPLKRSVEFYALDPDGHRLTVRGGMTGAGSVDPTATHAEYLLTWLGVEIRQQTTRDGDRVTVDQQGPGFRGTQDLRRRADPRA